MRNAYWKETFTTEHGSELRVTEQWGFYIWKTGYILAQDH